MESGKRNLVIVEASGKIDILSRTLRQMGFPAEVLATVGHIAENPRSLANVALDTQLRETQYAFRDDRLLLLEKIQRAAALADRIYLAMDDDQEGDVIAHDIAWVLSDHESKLQRVRLRAISDSELRDAFNAPLSRDFDIPANNGITRRIVDRAIGATFSSIENQELVSVGRVQSSLLISIDEVPPVVGRYVIKTTLGTEAFSAEIPVRTKVDLERCQRIEAALKQYGLSQLPCVSDEVLQVPVSTPWGYSEIVDEVSGRLKLPIRDVSQALQDCYERGKISYPRAGRDGYSQDAVEIAIAIARQNRAAIDAGIMPMRSTQSRTHESPRPIDSEMSLGQSLSVLDTPDAVAMLISRNMIECAQQKMQRKVGIQIDDCRIDFLSETLIGLRPWKRHSPSVGYTPFPRDRALLRHMNENCLGRASTVVDHVTRFLQRDLLRSADSGGLVLNEKGLKWAERAREVGFTRETSTQMEAAFSGVIVDANRAARQILSDHGMIDKVMERVSVSKVENSYQNMDLP